MSFTFTGSRALSMVGEKDLNVHLTTTLNGQPYSPTGIDYPELFRTEELDNGSTYTFELTYSGEGRLAVVALYIEKAGHAIDPADDVGSSPPPTSTTATESVSRSTALSETTSTTTHTPEVSRPAASSPTTSDAISSSAQSGSTTDSSPMGSPAPASSTVISSTTSSFTSSSPTSTSARSASTSMTTLIAACASGGVTLAVILLFLVAFCLWRSRRRRRRPEPVPTEPMSIAAVPYGVAHPVFGLRDRKGGTGGFSRLGNRRHVEVEEGLPTYTESSEVLPSNHVHHIQHY
ncbi:hypothetical protein EXIGLDRAFT_726698 [Exidia glandulosa HHB12029]|uniref:Mid2 domain-containing protein n=1 Tax=Exidia glandulosa HHB12029 TaxID=1314781 RepID=A0A165DLH5_EXIGL|nr:hypothetical protein EXIGLDRAFT_726698 [Exidia glandulosa HHB12029]